MKVKPLSKIRVMTYNVHSCRGLDRRVDPERICRVIEKYSPDFLALQELDVNKKSSQHLDQPTYISRYLRMHCHFQPAIVLEKEHYGIAILSRYPFEVIKADCLTRSARKGSLCSRLPLIKCFYEPRGAIGVRIPLEEREIIFFNTHLGLDADERYLQTKDLLSADWLGGYKKDIPIIFCGDLNSGPKSRSYKIISQEYKEVKVGFKKEQKRKTFYSYFPLFELDHIFYTGNISLASAQIPSIPLTRMASDHLPLIADFNL
ncbi:MAG: endonuclease/exonuclease/phosphatase family protein [Candidatus Omnitrophica bacterium]|nr:endonuclease/exonuclease/phosphatase family protein [Candidatus Omnitrophota bacterium]